MYPTLREFVHALDASGELRRVRAPVSPVLEIAAITDRVSKSAAAGLPSGAARRTDPRFHALGGHALLFESVQRPESLGGGTYDMPVAINLWGSYRRMEMALGCDDAGHTPGGFEGIAAKIGELVKPEPPKSLGELVRAVRRFWPLLRIPPRRRRGRGLCQQVIHRGDAVDLYRLPLIRCWPQDGDFAALGYPAGVNDGIAGLGQGVAWDRDHRGRYITLAGVHTIHADDRDASRPSSHNIGMYRVQLLGPRTLAMHWHVHHDGARHWRSWKALGERMPVAIVLGGESVMPYAATAPLPPGISELLLAGYLNRGGIPMVRGVTVPLWVPANAEIVIEGYVDHRAGPIGYDPRTDGPLGPGAVFEGPFGDHTGFYSLPDRYPLLEVTAITHRRDPIYPTTIVGLPPQEDYYLGKATERIFLPLLKTLIHDIEDYDLPMFGAFHNCAALQIRKAYPLQGRRVMHSVWGAGQMAWTKTIFVVDESVDVHDTPAVLRAAGERCHPLRDIETVHGPLDILDHAAPRLGAGMKIGFDCTVKIPGEEIHGIGVGLRGTPSAEPPTEEMLNIGEDLIRALPGVVDAHIPRVASAWLLVSMRKQNGGDGAALIERIWAVGERSTDRPAHEPAFVILLGDGVDVRRLDEALFHWCAHADASRDLYRWASPDGKRHRIAFDATPKRPGDERAGQPVRPWPPILEMDRTVVQRVNQRWGELFPGGSG